MKLLWNKIRDSQVIFLEWVVQASCPGNHRFPSDSDWETLAPPAQAVSSPLFLHFCLGAARGFLTPWSQLPLLTYFPQWHCFALSLADFCAQCKTPHDCPPWGATGWRAPPTMTAANASKASGKHGNTWPSSYPCHLLRGHQLVLFLSCVSKNFLWKSFPASVNFFLLLSPRNQD